MTTSVIHPELLHVGDTAAGTVYARRGPIVAIDGCGVGCRCITFATGVEVVVHPGDLWIVGGGLRPVGGAS